jgi:hypothetical protein
MATIKWLMLFREITAVCSENHTKHINTLYGQNEELARTLKQVVYIVTTRLWSVKWSVVELLPQRARNLYKLDRSIRPACRPMFYLLNYRTDFVKIW